MLPEECIKTRAVKIEILRAPVSNFRDMAARLQIFKTLIFCLRDTFGELSSKIILKFFENL